MARETRSAKYAQIRDKINNAIELDENLDAVKKVNKIKENLSGLNNDFFVIDEQIDNIDDVEVSSMSKKIETNLEELFEEEEVEEESNDEISIIEKLEIKLSDETFTDIQSASVKNKIEHSREIRDMVSEIKKSNDSLDINIKKNMCELSVKLQELDVLKKSANKEETAEAEKDVDAIRTKIIEQTNEFKLQVSEKDFKDYDLEKKLTGIENAILNSKSTKMYFVITVLVAISLTFIFFKIIGRFM